MNFVLDTFISYQYVIASMFDTLPSFMLQPCHLPSSPQVAPRSKDPMGPSFVPHSFGHRADVAI